jgi:hypothetical protein
MVPTFELRDVHRQVPSSSAALAGDRRHLSLFQRVEALGISADTGETLGIGYAPRGMMKGYVLSLFDCQPAD